MTHEVLDATFLIDSIDGVESTGKYHEAHVGEADPGVCGGAPRGGKRPGGDIEEY